jgi:hypothetical protein
MNSKQLYDLVEKDPCLRRVVKGVYASNTLPKRVHHYPSAFIVNNQPLPLSGEHWLAIIIHNPYQSEFFDSLGKPLSTYNQDIRDFIANNSNHCDTRNTRLQSINSNLCGNYVLMFLLVRLSVKKSLTQLYTLFSDDYQSNDHFVQNFVYRYFFN